MKKINLKGISEILSEKELKNVMGGSDSSACSDGKVSCSCNGVSQGCKTPSDCCKTCGVKC